MSGLSRIKITQIKSTIGRTQALRGTLRALGLRGINQTVVHPRSPEVEGAVRKVNHLVKVEEVRD